MNRRGGELESGAWRAVSAEVRRLRAIGKERGFIWDDELEEVFGSVPAASGTLARFFGELAADGTRVRSRSAGERLPGPDVGLPEGSAEPEVLEGEPDLVRVYLDEIGRYGALGEAEERALSRAARAGDVVARKRLILSHLKFVVSIARQYQKRGLELLDLIEEGNLGLIRAVDRFDPDEGYRLSTYAVWWIRQSVSRAIANYGRTIRIPIHVIQLIGRYLKGRNQLERKLGRAATEAELAGWLGEDAERVQLLLRLMAGVRSLDTPASRDSLLRLAETSPGSIPSPEELVEMQLEHRRLGELLGSLTASEEAVLRIRYGFQDGMPHTLAETGAARGISRQRAKQIEMRALAKLRHFLERAERAAARQEGPGEGKD